MLFRLTTHSGSRPALFSVVRLSFSKPWSSYKISGILRAIAIYGNSLFIQMLVSDRSKERDDDHSPVLDGMACDSLLPAIRNSRRMEAKQEIYACGTDMEFAKLFIPFWRQWMDSISISLYSFLSWIIHFPSRAETTCCAKNIAVPNLYILYVAWIRCVNSVMQLTNKHFNCLPRRATEKVDARLAH